MNKQIILKTLLLAVAVTVVVVMLPRAGRHTISYEQGQPWRYQLLTAPFDIPVYLDSATSHRMTDSIYANFTPYVTYSTPSTASMMQELRGAGVQGAKAERLAALISESYMRGVLPDTLKEHVQQSRGHMVRTASDEDDNTANAFDASDMLSLEEACKWVIDHYEDTWHSALNGISPEDVDALRTVLRPNLLPDSANNVKFMELELQAVSAGQGKIRQGQRIVDRGEIITPQIYTNLQTYEDMLSKSEQDNSSRSLATIVFQCLYVLAVYLIFYLYLGVYRPRYFSNMRYLSFAVGLVTIFTLLATLLFENFSLGIFLAPFACVPVIVLIFMDSRTAIAALVTTVALSALVATYQFQFFITEIAVGFLATVSLNQLSRRSQLLRASFIVFVSYCICAAVMVGVSGADLQTLDWRLFLAYGINSVLFSITYVLILLIEKIFGFTSTVTLVELSDINNPLLRRLAEEAPGTFQHSMQVSTLAAEAARAVGANTQLVRTAALYHDIGKLNGPIFYTENQHGVNPHDGLSPQMSASKIIGHVTGGVKMAEKAKLPPVIIDFIRQHHGRGLTRYFYNTALNASPHGEVDKAPFTYPGPNPQTRETAIMMMADAVEAASRSLKEYTPESIASLVDKIVDSQVADGMFRESPLSFADVERIKETFRKRLSTIYHTRVAYPDAKPHKN